MSSQSSLPTKIISLGRRWRVPPPLTRNHEVRLIAAFTFDLYNILLKTSLFTPSWYPDRRGESLKPLICACVVFTVAILGIGMLTAVSGEQQTKEKQF